MGRLAEGAGADRSGSGARPRRELPLHADRRAAERAGDARLRRRADAARRPRAERLHLRRARRRRHPHRHPLDHRRRHRRAEGTAARRRQRRRHAAAARDRQGRAARRRPKRRCARSWRARRRFPASATACITPRIRARRTCAQMSRDLGQRAGEPMWFEMSQRIEALVKAEKKLNPNVDFYSATTYHALGIDVDLFTPIFAVSRVSGWTAHVLEQYANNRLIRPRAEYIGPAYPQRYRRSMRADAAARTRPGRGRGADGLADWRRPHSTRGRGPETRRRTRCSMPATDCVRRRGVDAGRRSWRRRDRQPVVTDERFVARRGRDARDGRGAPATAAARDRRGRRRGRCRTRSARSIQRRTRALGRLIVESARRRIRRCACIADSSTLRCH